MTTSRTPQRNVLGTALVPCSMSPLTGFYRTGCCETGSDDRGVHVVCAELTAEFLAFSKRRGNDLTAAGPGFPGLSPGDCWCLCVSRWKEAYEAGVAPKVVLASTHEAALATVTRDSLLAHAIDGTSLN